MKQPGISRIRSAVVHEFGKLGFEPLGTSSVLFRQTGEVIACVFSAKSRMDQSAQVIVGFWHPELSTDEARTQVDKLKVESIQGDLSEWGVGAEKWWPLDRGDDENLRACIWDLARPLIDSIQAANLLARIGAQERGEPFQFEDPLAKKGIPSAASSASNEQFPDRRLHRQICKAALIPSLSELKFACYETDRQLAFVRNRGDLIDVIEPIRASMGFHTYFNCYVTTKAFWSVRKELRSLLVQTNGGELGEKAFSTGIRSVETAALGSIDVCALIATRVREQAIPFFDGISDRSSFLNALGRGWEGTLRPGLSRLWA